MTQIWECTEARPSLGVYVLGAIDPAERGLVDAHLATCADCRDELAGLAGLPALLARVSPDEVGRIMADDPARTVAEERPPEELLGTVLSLTEARRRRTRWRYLSAAAAVVVIAAGLFGGLQTTRIVHGSTFSAGSADWDSVQVTSLTTGASATIDYAHEQWGNAYQVLVDHIPVGTTCQLWIVYKDGTRTAVATWTTANDEGHVWYPGSTPNNGKAISSFEITAGNRVLVTARPV